nr:aminodeoxychorismate synthase component I [Membranihabitans maritimus]
MINYDQSKTIVLPISELKNQRKIQFAVPGFDSSVLNTNAISIAGEKESLNQGEKEVPDFFLDSTPLDFEDYAKMYLKVKNEIENGNTYLLNLTTQTPIYTNLGLQDIYKHATAKYKLYYNNQFTVFSPETFITIKDGIVKTYPMKGTINADLPNSKNQLANNRKEMAEHASIVDLLRNDLGSVSNNIKVNRFRYFEYISTSHKNLWQVSSEIQGELPKNYKSSLGSIIFKLLPAGSVTGVPKQKTLEIIKETEGYDRGFYTGIFGYYDGANLESAVMIRFIEKIRNQLWYKSGGGIHELSNPKEEYEELINKIYVPIPGKYLYK